MLENSLPLARIFSIQLRVHWSWLILGGLITASLAIGWFPTTTPGLNSYLYWISGAICALGLFVSIVIHEFAHALIGKSYDMPIEGITLFLFGGVSQLSDEPPHPKSEFQMAIAGPLASVFLAGIFYFVFIQLDAVEKPETWHRLLQAIFSYLASVNLIVAIFNMLPGFPLDGGRVLRSILWSIKKDIVWATKISTAIGQGFGWALVGLGFVYLLTGQPVPAIWSFLLGLLLNSLAKSSYLQLLIKQNLIGKTAKTFMDPTPVAVSPDTPVSELMNDFFKLTDQTLFPVVDANNEFLGCVDIASVKRITESEWPSHTVRELLQECPSELQIGPDTEAEKALSQMSSSGSRELIVIRDHRLLGLLRQTALLRYLSLRQT